MKNLVAYFSASGVTKSVAQKLNEVVEGKLYEIIPETMYTEEDLNWMDKNSRSSIEMRDKSSRVNIKEKLDSISEYENIYIGFPVWWYTCPHIINTFLESFDFSNKNVRLFCTSGSTNGGTVYKSLKDEYPYIKECKRFSSNVDIAEIKEWVQNGN